MAKRILPILGVVAHVAYGVIERIAYSYGVILIEGTSLIAMAADARGGVAALEQGLPRRYRSELSLGY